MSKISITVSFEMEEKTAKLFLQSAIERVINTSVSIVTNPKDAASFENRDINLEDWDEWKPVVCMLWSAIHDKVYRKMAAMPDDNRVFTLRKGDLS